MTLTSAPHGIRAFYKYTSAHAAKTILVNRSLRWCAPTQFNDPFDVTRELARGINTTDIQNALTQEICELLRAPLNNYSHLRADFADVLKKAHRLDKAALEKSISELQATPLTKIDDNALELIREMWRKEIPALRILCLSARHDSVSMWNHYASNYKGVVIELSCSEQLDSPWLLAKPIIYSDTPEINTARGWAKLITLSTIKMTNALIHACVYNKRTEWNYEQEWRVHTHAKESEVGECSNYQTDIRNFSRIILGPNISDDDKRDILGLLTHDLAHVQAVQAIFDIDQLIFETIK